MISDAELPGDPSCGSVCIDSYEYWIWREERPAINTSLTDSRLSFSHIPSMRLNRRSI